MSMQNTAFIDPADISAIQVVKNPDGIYVSMTSAPKPAAAPGTGTVILRGRS
ncbi:MAG TPA: hypothetical protein VL547_14020 [Dinghuibacter sp.]|uniref:hypothetical protein n=1 Tax=Dinghuibacter sp. TaxID=2024697 RepID=UPI002CF1EDD5|nr:hypothetical protein [Dinghuibacter sp.]HTJ13146.1 hypothetical protein [Dinghuibacter sp.]